jgi:hypothetical protein
MRALRSLLLRKACATARPRRVVNALIGAIPPTPSNPSTFAYSLLDLVSANRIPRIAYPLP